MATRSPGRRRRAIVFEHRTHHPHIDDLGEVEIGAGDAGSASSAVRPTMSATIIGSGPASAGDRATARVDAHNIDDMA